MSQPLFESLQNSSSSQEFISSIKTIIKKNDPLLRVKEIIPIILGKKQLILDNNNKDQQQKMIKSVGDLFKWLIPKTANLPVEELKIEEEIRAAASEFCATPKVEAFFLEVMLPNAFEEDAIYVTARAVCKLVAFGNRRKLFISQFTAGQLLEMAARAPTQKALEWSFGAMLDITEIKTDDAEDSVLQNYVTEENAKLLLQAFQSAEDETCLERAAEVLRNISYCKSDFSQICTEEFASAVLNKLSVTKSTRVVASLCGYIVNVALSHSDFCSSLCTEDAAKILLRASDLVNDDDSADFFCFAIDNLAWSIGEDDGLNFATQEFCAAIVRCFDFAETDDSRHSCAGAISSCAGKCESACRIFASIPNIVEKLHDAIKNTKDLDEVTHLFGAIANICVDKESTRPFANLETLQLLVDSRKKVTDKDTLKTIDTTMDKIVLHFPEFLDFCAAQSDATSEHQLQLLKVETLDQLATFLEYDFNALFQKDIELYVRQRSLVIICEKLDQFILSREQNEKEEEEFQEFLSRISQHIYFFAEDLPEEILNQQFFETVVFSLLQHGTGATCVDTATFVRWRIRKKNPPALSSSMLKVILEKMDEADKETCLETDLNGECFFSVGLQLLRRTVSKDSKDVSKSFFVENLNLINRVFKKGYNSGDENIQENIDEAIGEFRSFIPRMTHAPQIFIEKESGQRRDRDGNPSFME
jgi:hypothetical protein